MVVVVLDPIYANIIQDYLHLNINARSTDNVIAFESDDDDIDSVDE